MPQVPWGTHFCQFYKGRQDLVETLVPYFKAGLEANEFCLWITSEPLGAEAARAALAAEVPDLDRRVRDRQIEILDYSQWYTLGGRFDADRVLRGWVEKLDDARQRGFAGLRLSGNTFWLETSDWRSFTDYEAAVDGVLGRYRMLALCTYSLARCGAAEIMDVVSNHEFALVKRQGRWSVIESAERKKAELSLRRSEERFRSLFERMTEGFALHEVILDAQGAPCDYRFLEVNPAFERLTGLKGDQVIGRTAREVLPGLEDHWLQAYGRVALGGAPVRFENYAAALGRHYEVLAFRPAPGQFAVLFTDVTERWRTEQTLRELHERAAWLARFPEENPNPVLRVAADGTALYRNPSAARLPGWTCQPGQPLEEPLRSLVARSMAQAREVRQDLRLGERLYAISAVPLAKDSYVNIYGRDVTEGRRTEEALRRKQAELQVLFDNTPAGLVLFDAQPPYRVLAHNRYYQELFSEPYRSSGMVGLNVHDYAPAVEASGAAAVFDEVVRTAQPKHLLDFPYQSDPPKRSWFDWHMLPLVIDGQVVALVSMSVERTERHLAEEELQRARNMLAEAQKIAHLGSFEYVVATRTTVWSEEEYRIYGLDPAGPSPEYDEMLRKCIHPDDAELLDRTFTQAMQNRSVYELEHRIVRPDGGVRWVYDRAQPHFDEHGSLLRYVGATLDITERRLVEEALRHSEERLRLAQAAAGAGTWVWDMTADRLEWSEELFRLFGLDPGRGEASFDAWTNLLHPDDRELAGRRIEEAVARHSPLNSEYRVVLPSGEVRWIAALGSTAYDGAGRPLRMSGICLDITARRRAEQELLRTNQRLDLLARTAGELLKSASPQAAVDRLCREVMAFLDCDVFFNFLVDDDAGRLHLNAWAGIPEEEARRIEWLDFGAAVCGCVARDACRIVAENIPETPDPRTELVSSYGVRAYACHPLLGPEGKVIGTLSFGSRSHGSFGAEDLALMKAVADHVATAMVRIRSERALQESNDALERSVAGRTAQLSAAVEALRHSEGRLREAQRMARIGNWELDLAGGALVWSDEIYRIFEIDPRDFSPSYEAFLAAIHPEDREAVDRAYTESLKTGTPYEIAHRLLMKDGRVKHVHERCETFYGPDGAPLRSVGTVQDITDRERAAAAERQAHSDLSQIFNGSSDGMRIIDKDARIVRVNRAFLEIVGRREEEVVGRACREVLSSGHCDTPACPIARIVNGEPSAEVEVRLNAPDGQERYYVITASPYRSPEGELLGVLEDYRDITQRRQLETQLAQAQKMEAVGRLAGGVAHDFNNLMQVVEGHARRALRDLADGDPRRAGIAEVIRSAERATALTRQLLAFGRKQVLHPDRLDLNAVLRDTAAMLARLLGEDIATSLELDPELPPIMADRAQVEQVIMNLALNARDAMPEGGVLTLATARFTSGGAQAESFALLTVTDTGCGMDEETRERIFEPFFTTKAPGLGTGLGLATVYSIVEQSGGGIEVRSEPGKGSSFRIRLPLAGERSETVGDPAPPAALREGRAAASSSGRDVTVLVVEDEDALRHLVRLELEDQGYTVLQARNLGEALRVVEHHRGCLDLLLSDVVLPGVGGPRLHEMLAGRLPGLKVLYMSGHTQKYAVQLGKLGPGAAFIEKPFTTEALVAKIREVLGFAPENAPARAAESGR